MTAFVVTANVNGDTLTPRTGGDTLTINGGFVTIDEDTRYGVNANTSAVWAAITPSATLGGSIFFDARAIWLIPYTGGSGNVPAYNTTISKGGASGLLIGVYSALNVAPTTPGSAMPATGFIKVKQWNGTLYGTGALTGITATAAAGETVGWIEVVGQEGSLCLLSSLNQQPSGAYDGSFAKGDWYTVGTTSGSRATSYQVPSNGSAVWHGAFMVDKAAATAITAASWSAGVATFTSTGHGLTTNDRVMVDAILPRTWRTVDTQRCTVVNANTFTVPMPVNPGAYTSGGTVAAQEWWAVTDSLNTKVGPEPYRGKHCWLDSATGLLRFGNDNTTSTGGDLPGSGRVIRMPNIVTANAAAASRTVNTHPTSLASRWRYYNGNAGTIRASHLSGVWSTFSIQTGKAVYLSDCTFTNHMTLASQAAPCTVTNVGIGGNSNTATTSCCVISSMTTAVTVLDSCFSTGEMGTRYPVNITNSYGALWFDRCRFTGTGDRTASTYGVNANIGQGATFTNCGFGPHSVSSASQFSDAVIKPFTYYSAAYGFNQITFASPTVNVGNLSRNWEVSDPAFFGATPLGRTSVLSTASGSDGARLRNWGTEAAPIDMRLNGDQPWRPWTRVTTVATVTETGHPYRVGDICYVYDTTNGAAISRAAKTITATTANTFDFACASSGSTSGFLSYYVGGIGALLVTAATSDTVLQNVHIRGNTAQALSATNTCFDVALDNVTTEQEIYNLTPTHSANGMRVRSLYGNDYPIHSQQASIFGTHFTDLFQRDPSIPGQSAPVTGASWTRATATITVTSPAHGLNGASQRIWVENSSATNSVPNGWGNTAITLTVLDANTFTFTGISGGGPTSGTLDYWLVGDSTFRVVMNEASPASAGQATITANAGAAGFTGAGSLVLPAVGDQATWETPDFFHGYESFAHTPAIPYGASITSAAQIQGLDIEYQMDRGAGFGAWRNAAYYRPGAGGAAAATTVTMTSTTGVQVGDYVQGAGIGTGAKVQSITNATDIVVTVANDATVSGTLVFWYMPNETTFPSTGIRMKVRATANTANAATIYQIDFPLLSSSTSRARLYSQLTQYTLTFTNLVAGSDIRILEAGTVSSELDADNVAGTTYAFDYFYAAGTYVDIQVLKDGYKPFRFEGYLLGEGDADFLVQQVPAIDEGL